MPFRSLLQCLACVSVGIALVGMPAQASNFTYAVWNNDTLSSGGVNGSVSGTIAGISIVYSGDVVNTTQINNTGTNYYSSYPSVYTNSTVSNLPTNIDLVALSEASAYTDTITFATAVTNPILDIVSLGPGVSYVFKNATPVILSQGSAYFAGCSTCLSVSGNTLTGNEGDGVVQFLGTFTSLSWTTSGNEYWNGFTVGIAGLATPEPSTLVLFAGFALFIPFLRRLQSSKA